MMDLPVWPADCLMRRGGANELALWEQAAISMLQNGLSALPLGCGDGRGARMNVQIDIGDSGLAQRLRREISGEVLFGAADRGRYATDASIYQMAPVGVIVPRRIEDVMAALAICREEGVPVLPRGGGTSQCG